MECELALILRAQKFSALNPFGCDAVGKFVAQCRIGRSEVRG
ncbi:MAG: hypothetical protein ACI841_004285 [Planctomycetota bacterium]|jgi:hypothetical protein